MADTSMKRVTQVEGMAGMEVLAYVDGETEVEG